MKYVLALLALLLAGTAAAAPLPLPPQRITSAEVERLMGEGLVDPVRLADLERRALVGFVLAGRPGTRAVGAYVWSPKETCFREFYASSGGVKIAGATIPVTASLVPLERELLREVIPTLHARLQAAVAVAPVPARQATPAPTNVTPTFVDRALLATVGRVVGFLETHRTLGILGILVFGCVLGARARRPGPRPLVVRSDDVVAALAASERALAADRARLQELSATIDAEETRFVQRVSAITERR